MSHSYSSQQRSMSERTYKRTAGRQDLRCPFPARDPRTMRLQFRVACDTSYGESVSVAGGLPGLGEWKLERALPLRWFRGEWVGIVEADLPGSFLPSWRQRGVRRPTLPPPFLFVTSSCSGMCDMHTNPLAAAGLSAMLDPSSSSFRCVLCAPFLSPSSAAGAAPIEYKYVKIGTHGGAVWEQGSNHSITCAFASASLPAALFVVTDLFRLSRMPAAQHILTEDDAEDAAVSDARREPAGGEGKHGVCVWLCDCL